MKAYRVKKVDAKDSPYAKEWNISEESIAFFISREKAEVKADECFKDIWIHEELGKVVDPSRRIIGLLWDENKKFSVKKLSTEEWHEGLQECIQVVIEEIDIEENS